MNEYENLAIAVAMIDAAMRHLEDAGTQDDAVCQLHGLRNGINADRVALLGNGQCRPFHVEELNLT